jgi:hypothetical protein
MHRAETFHFGNKSKRDITAPSFHRDEGITTLTPDRKEVTRKDFIDYSNFQFVPLEDEKNVTFEKVRWPSQV